MSGRTHASVVARCNSVLAVLTRCASEGSPCPSNAELARMVGVEGTSTAARVLVQLEERGDIAVARFGNTRIVTILATGKQTGGTPGTTHWRDRDPAPVVEKKAQTNAAKAVAVLAKPEPVRVNREPCFFCNVRADVGCKHTRRSASELSFPPVHR